MLTTVISKQVKKNLTKVQVFYNSEIADLQNLKFYSNILSVMPDICLKFMKRWVQIGYDVCILQIYYIWIPHVRIFGRVFTAQKMNFFNKDFCSKSDQICSYYTETSQLICRANQWTGFYMITADLVTFTEQILNGKLHFLYSA